MAKLKSNPNSGISNPKATASASVATMNTNTASKTNIYAATTPISAVLSSSIASLDQHSYTSYTHNHYIDLLLILPEEMLSGMLEYMERKLTGKQRMYFSCLISDLITKRRFSEDFLLQYCEYLEDINDILVVHRYEIVNDIYKTLRFHLVGNKDVEDIL